MEKLTDTFGKSFENIGLLYESLQPIAQNPAFSRMISTDDEKTICIADKHGDVSISSCVKIPNYCASHMCMVESNGKRYSQFSIGGQPILTVRENEIIMCARVQEGYYRFEMVRFFIDNRGYLHVRMMGLYPNNIEITNTIYDRNGVELQQDSLSDKVNARMRRLINTSFKNQCVFAKNAYELLTRYPFQSSLGRDPQCQPSPFAHYLSYRRNMERFEYCIIHHDWGKTLHKRLDIGAGLATMQVSDAETYPATKDELVASIALEENEDTRNALIAYTASRKVTKELVDGVILKK